MSGYDRQHDLIRSLGAELQPVDRLRPPWLRAMGWLLLVASVATLLLAYHGASSMLQRWAGTPDSRLAAIGAALTTGCAAWSAFALAVPGGRRAWAWLPVPALLLWVGASGIGCMRMLAVPGGTAVPSTDCLFSIVGFSIPLSALMIWLLRRAYPLRPVIAAAMAGLACAGASATLLETFHAADGATTDLLVHALAVALVVVANAVLGGRLLSRHQGATRNRRPASNE
jgi:hypothetical protein